MIPSRSRAAAVAFAQGLVLISLTTRLPDFQDRGDLSELVVSLLLLTPVLLAGVVGQDSLRYGFAVPVVLVLCVLPLARPFAASPTPAP